MKWKKHKEEQLSRRWTLRFGLKTLLTLPLAAAIVLAAWKPLAVVYYRGWMHYTGNRFMRESGTPRRASYQAAFDSRLEALVALGYFERRKFRLRHVTVASPAGRALFAQLRDHYISLNPKDRGSLNMGGSGADRPGAITVWARPQQMPDFAAVVEEHDAP